MGEAYINFVRRWIIYDRRDSRPINKSITTNWLSFFFSGDKSWRVTSFSSFWPLSALGFFFQQSVVFKQFGGRVIKALSWANLNSYLTFFSVLIRIHRFQHKLTQQSFSEIKSILTSINSLTVLNKLPSLKTAIFERGKKHEHKRVFWMKLTF